MTPPRGAIADFQIAVRFTHGAGDVLFNGLHGDAEPVRDLLVGALVEHSQGKGGTALRRQPVDSLLDQPVPFIPEQSRFQRFAFFAGRGILQTRQHAALDRPLVAVFIRGQIARCRKEESPERSDRIALPVGTQERLLDDFLRCLAGADEAPDITVQCLATLGEELGENLGAGLRCRRHSRMIRSAIPYPYDGPDGNYAKSSGGFPPLRCRTFYANLSVLVRRATATIGM